MNTLVLFICGLAEVKRTYSGLVARPFVLSALSTLCQYTLPNKMDAKLQFRLNNSAPVTAFTYHPLRREVITGHEDGTIKGWEAETGKFTIVFKKHHGMITDLLFWSEGRVLLSSAVDGLIVQWTSSGVINGSNDLDGAIYALAWYSKLNVFLVGRAKSISVLKLSGKQGSLGHPLLTKTTTSIGRHTDIVCCIETNDNRIYSAGYDRQLCIYEVSSIHGNSSDQTCPIHLAFVKENAHEAGINCLVVAKDIDWIFTGSFDRQVKIWTSDGKPLHSLQFMDTVTGIGYVPETHILWVAAVGSSSPYHFEPKSGDNISVYLDHSSHSMTLGISDNSWQRFIQHLKYIPETSEIIGVMNSKEVVLLRYNSSATVSCQQLASNVESLTYTKKIPILIFSATSEGEMLKWERLQLNPFVYSKESLAYKETLKQFLETDSGSNNLSFFLYGPSHSNEDISEEESQRAKVELMKSDYRGFLKTLFVESMDYLIASSRDGKIFVWGFDMKAAAVLRQMSSTQLLSDELTSSPTNSNSDSRKEPTEEELVTYNRVAGFICQYILNRHCGPVQALALVENSKKIKSTCLISAGWDLKICIWTLENGQLAVQLDNCIPAADKANCDDLLITDIAYSQSTDTFLFSASNNYAYLMSFSLNNSEVKLLETLSGHHDEVTQVAWNPCNEKWVTGSEDGTICIWSSDGKQCTNTVSTNGPVSVLCIDHIYNLIIAGVKDLIKVYNDNLDVVQVSQGHNETVSNILYIPELKQYISTSNDGTLRIWNSYTPKEISKDK